MTQYLLLFLFFTSCTSKPVTKLEIPKSSLVRTKNVLQGDYAEFMERFVARNEMCEITWEITKLKSVEKRNIFLRFHGHGEQVCHQSFSELRSTHELILQTILTDYPADTIKSLVTSSLQTMNPEGSWNFQIAEAGLVSLDWADFRKNYPKNKSKKTSNKIFVDLLLSTDAHKEFKTLLWDHHLSFEVFRVEKVFSEVLDQRSFGKQIPESIKGRRVIYDAGMLEWQ